MVYISYVSFLAILEERSSACQSKKAPPGSTNGGILVIESSLPIRRHEEQMTIHLYPYHGIITLSFLITLTLIHLLWRYREHGSSRYIIGVLMFVLIWITGQWIELATEGYRSKLLWANIQFIAIMGSPAAYVLLAASVSGNRMSRRPRLTASLLAIVPLTFLILLFTDSSHQLMRQGTELVTNMGLTVIEKSFTPLFWAFVPYNFIICLFCVYLLIRNMVTDRSVRVESALLLTGLLLPLTTTALHTFELVNFPVDLSPAIFSISCLLISWGVVRYRMFRIIPVAYSQIVSDLKTGIIILDTSGRVAAVNPSAAALLGLKPMEVIGSPAAELFSTNEELARFYLDESLQDEEIEITIEGRQRYYELSKIPFGKEPLIRGRMVAIYDITARKRSEELIRYAADHDHLTGLINRGAFLDHAEALLSMAGREQERIGCIFIDLDNFKQINDTHGHAVGDIVLKKSAALFQRTLRQYDVASRFGGDEFVLLLPGIRSQENLVRVARKVAAAFQDPIHEQIILEMSMGLSLFPDQADSIEELIACSDEAMYQAKQQGKNSICCAVNSLED